MKPMLGTLPSSLITPVGYISTLNEDAYCMFLIFSTLFSIEFDPELTALENVRKIFLGN